MSRVRVLVLAPTFPPVRGGLEHLAQRVVAHLGDGIRTRVLALEPAAGSPAADDGAMDVRRLPGRRVGDRRSLTRYNLWAAGQALRFRPDVILSFHVTGSGGGLVAGPVLRAPLVQYVHAKEFGAFARLTRIAVRRAAAVIAVSDYTAGLAVSVGARPERVHRVHNGVDLPAAPDADRTGPPRIVTVSRLDDRYKGHDVVLDALPRVRAAVPDVEWVVIGEGPLRPELERRAREAGMGDVVRFLGHVDDAERDAALRAAHVFVMPSRIPPGGAGGEGFGIALLEANAHGLPVVAGRAGGVVDAVEDGRTAVLVDPADPGAVADAVIALLTDEERRRALGEAGIARSRGFSWDGVGAQVGSVLRAVAGVRA